MHAFQPFPINLIEFNPFEKFDKEWFMIVAGDHEKSNGMTASWGSVGTIWGKSVFNIYVRDSRYTKQFLDDKDTFSVNFLDKSYKTALKYIGAVSGRDESKIENSRLHYDFFEGTPYIDESSSVIVCKKLAVVPLEFNSFTDVTLKPKWYKDNDHHNMYIGEILNILAR